MLALCAAFWAQRKGIVASDYGGILGVPTLFERCYFSRLLNLADGEGAQAADLDAGEDAWGVSFSGGAFDLDTPQDYAKLQTLDGDHRPPYS